MCCLLEELSKYKQIRKCNVASFEKEKNQLRKCDVASCKKNATQKMQRWKLHFFCIFCCICFGAVPCFFAFFRFFFRKTIQKLIKVAKKCNGENATSQVARKNATEKMQRWKLLFFALSVPLFLAFAFSVAFLDFPDLLQLALWCCLEFSRQGMLLIEGGTATSLGARRHIAQELPGSLHVSLSFGQFQS